MSVGTFFFFRLLDKGDSYRDVKMEWSLISDVDAVVFPIKGTRGKRKGGKNVDPARRSVHRGKSVLEPESLALVAVLRGANNNSKKKKNCGTARL